MKYIPGQVWFCRRDPATSCRPGFFFVVLGPGINPRQKVCAVIVDKNDVRRDLQPTARNVVHAQSYSHAHLRKHAILTNLDPVEVGISEMGYFKARFYDPDKRCGLKPDFDIIL